jgi:hypothetical protein
VNPYRCLDSAEPPRNSYEQHDTLRTVGGYDAIPAVSKDLTDRLQEDPRLGRFWRHRGEDGLKRELQLCDPVTARAPFRRRSAPARPTAV